MLNNNSNKFLTTKNAFKAIFVFFCLNFLFAAPIVFLSGAYLDIELGNIAFLLASVVNMIFIYYLYRLKKNSPNSDFKIKLNRFSLLNFGLGLLGVFFLSVVTEPYLRILPQSEIQKYIQMFASTNVYVGFVTSVVLAPILEEYIFRAYIFRGLLNNYSPMKAVLVTSFLFGLVHFSVVQSPVTFLYSILWCIVYMASKFSLSTVIVLHATNNLISFVSLRNLEDGELGLMDIFDKNISMYWGIYACCVVLVVLLVYKAYRYSLKINDLN